MCGRFLWVESDFIDERGTGMGRVFVATAVAAALLLCPVAGAAGAETLTREEYVPRLESICKPRAEATRTAMDGVRDDVHDGRIKVAAHKFGRAAKIFGGTLEKIDKVAPPPNDTARIDEWFVYLNRQADYLDRIAAQLRAERTIKAQRLTARFIHNGNLANNVTLAFGFDYCSFKFSRYG
jgi:hypothetical protein